MPHFPPISSASSMASSSAMPVTLAQLQYAQHYTQSPLLQFQVDCFFLKCKDLVTSLLYKGKR
jgi:hypothetical protein